jgi:hypothetical protein
MKANFTDTETLDGSSKYKCTRCRAYVRAEKVGAVQLGTRVVFCSFKLKYDELLQDVLLIAPRAPT